MRLWTIQTEEAWRTLTERGYLCCSQAVVDRDFIPACQWMESQMITYIGHPANGIALPLWAWYRYNNDRHQRPDLRRSGHLPRGTRGYRIEFVIPDDDVLLSDSELWHYVLNYWYFPDSERDGATSSALHDCPPCSWSQPPRNQCVNKMIWISWERVFDLDWSDEYVAAPRENQSIQATFWQLDLVQVTTVDSFIAR